MKQRKSAGDETNVYTDSAGSMGYKISKHHQVAGFYMRKRCIPIVNSDDLNISSENKMKRIMDISKDTTKPQSASRCYTSTLYYFPAAGNPVLR